MRTREEIEKEFIDLNELTMSNEAIRLNFKADILLEVLLEIIRTTKTKRKITEDY